MGVLTGVQTVEYPKASSSPINFSETIQIRWPDVTGSAFHLCVGTDRGKWDILSGDVGNRRQQLFDLSDLPTDVQTVYVQLITIAHDDNGAVGAILKITPGGVTIVPDAS